MFYRFGCWVLLSVAIHLIWYFFLLPDSKFPSPRTPSVPLTIEIRERAKGKGGNATNGKKPSPTGRPITLKNLIPIRSGKGALLGAGENTTEGNGEGGQGGTGDVVSMSLEEAIISETFLWHVWKKIDESLHYPIDFAEHRIEGVVTLQFELDRRGILRGETITTSSSSDLLETFSLVTIMQLFKEPMPESQWCEKQSVLVKLHLYYKAVIPQQQINYKKYDGIQGNRLYITKTQPVEPKLNKVFNEFFTRYIPPIIPIPGGFYVDVIRLYMYIENFSKPDLDDQRRIRIERFQEFLDLQKKQATDT